MNFRIDRCSTDGLGSWSEWEPIAVFKYSHDAKSYARYVESYQGEEAEIDRVQLRVIDVARESVVSHK